MTQDYLVNPIFFRKQYIVHARYRCSYPENTLLLYEHVLNKYDYNIIEADIVFTSDGVPVLNHSIQASLYKNSIKETIDISQTTFKELYKYSLLEHSILQITTLEELLSYVKKKKICVMLDLTFQTYTYKNYKTIYDMVLELDMADSVMWGNPDIFKILKFSNKLICQFDGSWGRKMLFYTFIKSFFCKQTIMSFSYYGGEVYNFANIVKWGHRFGFIMKVATVNEKKIAKQFWNIGTDLIITDVLKNESLNNRSI